jgi:hypothetical protein
MAQGIAGKDVSHFSARKEVHAMKPVRTTFIALLGIALATAILSAVRIGDRKEVGVAEGPRPSETGDRRRGDAAISATIVEKGIFVATRKISVSGAGRSKLLLPQDPFSPAPETEAEAGTVLWIDDSTGEIVCGPDETWSPFPDDRLLALSLSGFDDDQKNYYKSQPSTVEQAPGVAVVTFLVPDADRKIREGWLVPTFLLRVWIDTRRQTVICMESGF